MRIKKVVVVLLLVSVFIGIIRAEEPANKYQPDTTQLMKFLKKLKGRDFEISNEIEYFQGYPENKTKFAKEFYNDFLDGNMKFISPEYKTDSLKDSKFQKYLEKYPKFKFILARTKKIGDGDYYLSHKRYAHYGFRYYSINFDSDSMNGKEDIIYSEGYWNDEVVSDKALYELMNKSERTNDYIYTPHLIGVCIVKAHYKGKNKERTNDYNGIIKYKDRYYIYEVWDWDTMSIIKFYCWRKKKNKCLDILKYNVNLEEKTNE